MSVLASITLGPIAGFIARNQVVGPIVGRRADARAIEVR
jgi:hypothetical protein